MRTPTLPAAVLALAVLAFGGTAQAQATSAQASALAEKLFRQGKALEESGKYAEAIEKLRASQELDPSVGALLSIGDNYKKLKKFASAWTHYVAARDLAKARNDRRVPDAEQRIAEVEPRLAKLTLKLAAPPPGIAITDNGTQLPAASFDSALPVDPGSHAIVASAKGRKAFRTTIELAEGESRDVVVPALEAEEDHAVHEKPVPPHDGTGDTQRTVGVGLLIGGGAVTVAGLVFGGLALSKWDKVEAVCPDKQCRTPADADKTDSDRSSAKTFATISTVGVIVGVLAAGTGLTLLLTAPSKNVAMAPLLDGQTAGWSVTFRH